MPLVEINAGDPSITTRTNSKLKSSRWRKLAGVAGFLQLTLFLVIALFLASSVVIQAYTGVAPYHYEVLNAIKSGIMMRNLHVDIIEAHNYGISSVASGFLEETVQDGMVSKDIAISTELKRELEEADWGTVLTLYVFAAMIAMNQCFRGGQLLRASLKWKYPNRAWLLMKCWSYSITSFRNYLFGFIISTLLFATEVHAMFLLILVILWIFMCFISTCAHVYYKDLSAAILKKHDDDDDDDEEVI